MSNYELKRSDEAGTLPGNKEVANVLAQVLSDTFTIYLKTLNYHWNVEGSRFIAIHNLTDEQYHLLFESIDIIGERIRALGFYSPASYAEFSSITTIEDAKAENVSAEIMVKNLEKDHMHMVNKIKEKIPVVESYGDTSSSDLLSERINFHQKAAWMFRSIGK